MHLEARSDELHEEDEAAVPLDRVAVTCALARSDGRSAVSSRASTSTSQTSERARTKVILRRVDLVQDGPNGSEHIARLDMEEQDGERVAVLDEGVAHGREADDVVQGRLGREALRRGRGERRGGRGGESVCEGRWARRRDRREGSSPRR